MGIVPSTQTGPGSLGAIGPSPPALRAEALAAFWKRRSD